jgi:hypothetical protein
VESLVGEVNARVKGNQKYCNRGAGAEAMLQLRAAVLSEEERLDRYLAARPGSPYRRREKKSEHSGRATPFISQSCGGPPPSPGVAPQCAFPPVGTYRRNIL